MKQTKFFKLIIVFILLLMPSIVFSQAVTIPSKTIIFGDDISYPPYSFIDENGNPAGYNIDLAYAIGKTLGYNVEIHLSEWTKARQNLEAGNIDVISGMFYSKEREKVVSFSTKHSVTTGDIFANPKYRIKDISELKNAIVAVQKGDIISEYLSSLNLNIQIIEYYTVEDALRAVEDGKCKYAGVLKLPGLYTIEKNKFKHIEVQNLNLLPQDYCMAVKKGNEDLIIEINGALKLIQESGQLYEIQNKWLGVYEEVTVESFVSRYKWIFLSIGLLVIFLFFTSLALKQLVDIKTRALSKSNQDLLETRKQVEQLLKEENERLELLVEEKTKELNATMRELINKEKLASLGGLIAGISHEINTPLGVVVSATSYLSMKHNEFVTIINSGKLTKDALMKYLNDTEDTINILLTNITKSSELIKSLKQVSIDHTFQERSHFNLYQQLEQTLLSLRLEYKNFDYFFSIDCPKELYIDSYANAYSQILTNFILNSIRHGFLNKERGTVLIKVKDNPENIVLTYQDDGNGMDEKILNKIFDPFFTTNRNNGGSGLGLSVVHNLVTLVLKGTVTCESKPNQGTKFTLVLPKLSNS